MKWLFIPHVNLFLHGDPAKTSFFLFFATDPGMLQRPVSISQETLRGGGIDSFFKEAVILTRKSILVE